MPSAWPSLAYDEWRETLDTLHAHTQVLGKLAVALAPPEPHLQHTALRLTARGWETLPLPAPDASGVIVVALDLRSYEAVAEHSDGRVRRVPLTPDRAVSVVTREVLAAVGELAGAAVEIDPRPQETPWTTPLDEDDEHATFDRSSVDAYFVAATSAAQVLAALRAPYRGRSTPVNAWWGSFDLAVTFFSGRPASRPPATSSCATRWMPRRSRSAGGRVTLGIRELRSTPTHILRRKGSRPRNSSRRHRVGM